MNTNIVGPIVLGVIDFSYNPIKHPFPSAPTSLIATPSDGSVSISFTPSSNKHVLINYEYSLDGAKTFFLFSPEQTTSPVVISGLTNGITYEIALRGVNDYGSSFPSSVVKAKPSL